MEIKELYKVLKKEGLSEEKIDYILNLVIRRVLIELNLDHIEVTH